MSTIDQKIPKESVPNGQSKFLMCYVIKWFKCKLKPPNHMVNVVETITDVLKQYFLQTNVVKFEQK